MTTIKPSESTTIRPTREYFGPFSTSFREHAHLLVHWGYEDARDRIQLPENPHDKEETSITGFLAEAIKARFRKFDLDNWCKYYSLYDDPPVRSEGRSGIRRPRADLIIESTCEGRPEYVFEAKRLKKREHPVSGYTGSEGMGCFISGKYASRYDEAGMLGYVQSGCLAERKDKVKRKIGQDAEKLSLTGSQRDEQVIDAFPLEWVSKHNRNSVRRPIAIYHILLDCCVK